MWEASEGLIILVVAILIFAVISLPPRPRKARSRLHDSPGISGLNTGIPTPKAPDNVAQKGVSGGAVLDDSSVQYVTGDSGIASRGI